MKAYFARSEKLMGRSALVRLQKLDVLIVGTGGVGSWCAEALVRSGVIHLTLVDSDLVCESNVNRQLMATSLTIGQPKVSALRDRLLSINPEAVISIRQERFSEENSDSFHLEEYDYIIDAIDSIPDKAHLIIKSLETDARLFSAMGAALKTDPGRIEVAEFWKVKGCPLAKALRTRFKKTGQFPSRKFQCVFSEERLQNQPMADESDGDSGNGSCVHITGTFGFRLASLVLNDVIKD